jgi:hypothetical protein
MHTFQVQPPEIVSAVTLKNIKNQKELKDKVRLINA